MSWSPLLAGFSRLMENLPWVFLSPFFFCHNKYTKPSPRSLPNPPSYPHCKQVSLFVHGRECLTFSLPWPFLLSQTWRYRLSPNLWPLPMSCILFLSSWLFRDRESSETAYLTCDLNSLFFSVAVLFTGHFPFRVFCVLSALPPSLCPPSLYFTLNYRSKAVQR